MTHLRHGHRLSVRLPASLERLEQRSLMSASAIDPNALPSDRVDPSSILVRFRTGASGVDGAKVLPGTVVGRAVGLDRNLREVHLKQGVGVKAALAAYQKNPRVEY